MYLQGSISGVFRAVIVATNVSLLQKDDTDPRDMKEVGMNGWEHCMQFFRGLLGMRASDSKAGCDPHHSRMGRTDKIRRLHGNCPALVLMRPIAPQT